MKSKSMILILVIGWSWFSIGAVSLAIGLFRLFSINPSRSLVTQFALLGFHALTIFSAYMLVRLRPWARVTLQVPIALYAFWSLKDGLQGIQAMLHNSAFPWGLRAFAMGSIGFITAIWVALFLACLIVLNTKSVKLEIAGLNVPIA